MSGCILTSDGEGGGEYFLVPFAPSSNAPSAEGVQKPTGLLVMTNYSVVHPVVYPVPPIDIVFDWVVCSWLPL